MNGIRVSTLTILSNFDKKCPITLWWNIKEDKEKFFYHNSHFYGRNTSGWNFITTSVGSYFCLNYLLKIMKKKYDIDVMILVLLYPATSFFLVYFKGNTISKSIYTILGI